MSLTNCAINKTYTDLQIHVTTQLFNQITNKMEGICNFNKKATLTHCQ